jgi:hypothetical protein
MVFAEMTGSSALSAHGSGGSAMNPDEDAAADEDAVADEEAVAIETP